MHNNSSTIINLWQCNNNSKCNVNRCNKMVIIMNFLHLPFQKLNNKLIKQTLWHMPNKYNNSNFRQYKMMECWLINSTIQHTNKHNKYMKEINRRQVKNLRKLKLIETHRRRRGRRVRQKVQPRELWIKVSDPVQAPRKEKTVFRITSLIFQEINMLMLKVNKHIIMQVTPNNSNLDLIKVNKGHRQQSYLMAIHNLSNIIKMASQVQKTNWANHLSKAFSKTS